MEALACPAFDGETDGGGATGSTPALPTGAHTLRLLTGSLKAGDAARTLLSSEFVVGSYRPIWAQVDAGGRPLTTLTFVVRRDHPQYAGKQPVGADLVGVEEAPIRTIGGNLERHAAEVGAVEVEKVLSSGEAVSWAASVTG